MGGFIGVLLLNMFKNMLIVMGIPTYWTVFAQGFVLAVALALDYVSNERRRKALLAMGFVLLAARSIRQMSMLLVAGIMISYICSAITEFLITFAKDSDIVNLHGWTQGSFSGTKWSNVAVFTVIVLVSFLLVFLMSKPIGAFQMGESYAQSMGVNVKRFRVVLILMSSLIAGCVTAYAGPISFVGIAVPHLIKMLLKTAKPILVIPACFLGGGVFCMFCD